MSKEMDWDNFIPTREIREYDMKFREYQTKRTVETRLGRTGETQERHILECRICGALYWHKILQ